jgi:hypothetical protein
MPNKKGTGLLMVWADVPADKEDDFNRWYNEEHIPELLALPGVLNAARYEAVKSGPKHLACYELESPAVVQTDAWRNRPRSDWANRASAPAIATTLISNVYQMVHPATLTPEIAQSDMAPALQIGRMGVAPENDAEWNNWYSTVYVPNYEKVPGVIRGRRWKAVRGEPQYAVVYEFQHERVSESTAWEAQRDIDPTTPRIRPMMTHAPGSPGVWKKTFQL